MVSLYPAYASPQLRCPLINQMLPFPKLTQLIKFRLFAGCPGPESRMYNTPPNVGACTYVLQVYCLSRGGTLDGLLCWGLGSLNWFKLLYTVWYLYQNSIASLLCSSHPSHSSPYPPPFNITFKLLNLHVKYKIFARVP